MFHRYWTLTQSAPRAVALCDGGSGAVTSRGDLQAIAERFASQFRSSGLRPRDLIAVQLPNSSEFVAVWLAALKLDLVVIPVDRDASETEVAMILAHFRANALVYGRSRNSGRVEISTRERTNVPAVLPAETRLVKLTSGSTGMPKGIATSERNLIADFENIAATMDIRPDDVNFGAIPFSHSYGFSNLISPLILQGTEIVVSNDYLPQSTIELCNRFRCTVLPGIPMMFDHLASLPRSDGNFETVRTFISAGAPLPASTSRRFRERFGAEVHTFYGCSECGGITYDRLGAAVERGSVGSPMTGVGLHLDHARVAVRSGAVALGYLHDSTTFEPFTGNSFRTDDLVEFREDGEVTITGRAGDLINTAGKKVNPREVEQVILQIEGVRQVKVYGEPAGARGEVVAAAVVANPDVTRDQIRKFCRERLSAHKVPRIVKLIESIPVDERGKVKRAALAAL